MKKNILFLSVIFVSSVFWYTQQDIAYATLLSQKAIITSQINSDKYRLDDRVLRQEVIGMALKLKGVQLPSNYICKWYFADVTGDNWVCRAIEIAADNGIITRTNNKARPSDFITPEEATAIFMNAKGITYPKNVKIDPEIVYYQGKSQWIIDLDLWLVPFGIHMPLSDVRADIFRVAYQISIYEKGLKFISCTESDNGKARIYIEQKEFDISNFGDISDCRWIGLGRLFFRSWNKLYAELWWEVIWSELVELDLDNMKTKLLGSSPFISANGQFLTFWEFSDNKRILHILDVKTWIETKNTFVDMRWLIGSMEFSDDYQIFKVSTFEFWGWDSWLYSLNRTNWKITKKNLP